MSSKRIYSLFIFCSLFLSQLTIANEKRLVEFINYAFAKIPEKRLVECNNPVSVSDAGKMVHLLYYEMKIEPINGRPTETKNYILDKPYPEFNTEDEAAIFFTDFVRKNLNTDQTEYCTDIIKQGQKFTFKNIKRGTPSSCPSSKTDVGVVGSVHIHPGHHSDLSHSSQYPSVNDYAVAAYTLLKENKDIKHYMGGPSGQVLRYDHTNFKCKGSKSYPMVKYDFIEIKKPDVDRGEYQNPNSWTLLPPTERTWINLLCKKGSLR